MQKFSIDLIFSFKYKYNNTFCLFHTRVELMTFFISSKLSSKSWVKLISFKSGIFYSCFPIALSKLWSFYKVFVCLLFLFVSSLNNGCQPLLNGLFFHWLSFMKNKRTFRYYRTIFHEILQWMKHLCSSKHLKCFFLPLLLWKVYYSIGQKKKGITDSWKLKKKNSAHL